MGFGVCLINLPIVHRTGDPFGDIPFMPTGVMYLAGHLRARGVEVSILDGFGLAPARHYRLDGQLGAVGLTEDEIVARLGDARLVGVSVHSGMSHHFALRLAAKIRAARPGVPLVAGGHHPSAVWGEFLAGGYDYVAVGEGEAPLLHLARSLRDGVDDTDRIPGLACAGAPPTPAVREEDLDACGFAAADLLPLENYWALGMSHAPVRGRYIAITTSRGCPFNCRFCTTPRLLGRQWRTRSPRHIADEIEFFARRHGVEDIIIQDEAFGTRRDIARGLAEEIIARGLKVRIHLPSGVRLESLDEETLAALRAAGLVYMCLAPESGSERVRERMGKPLDTARLLRIASCARRLGIRVGAFFILGFEGETEEDRRMTRGLAAALTRRGLDEISVFIWTPLPGAEAFGGATGWARYEDLNWSPAWRRDYPALRRARRRLYLRWLAEKALFHPVELGLSLARALSGHCELKGEAALRRMLAGVFRALGAPLRRPPDGGSG